MKRHIIIEIETDESGEKCPARCAGLSKNLKGGRYNCKIFEVFYQEMGRLPVEPYRCKACRTAEIEIDERTAEKAQDCLNYKSNYPIYAVIVFEAYLKIAKAAGIIK